MDHIPNNNSNNKTQAPTTMAIEQQRRKFIYPAIYLVLAAALVTALWLYQTNKAENELNATATTASQDAPDEAVPASAKQDEVMHWPVADTAAIHVVTPFYSEAASAEDKTAAMMQYGDAYTPSVGISIARKDGQAFDVLAAKSGTVTRVETLPMLGNVIEVTHANKQKTVYDSLDTVSVKLDDKVTQGTVLGQAGRNELEKQHGIHVHFEVFNNDSPVNPTALLSPTLTQTTGAPSATATP